MDDVVIDAQELFWVSALAGRLNDATELVNNLRRIFRGIQHQAAEKMLGVRFKPTGPIDWPPAWPAGTFHDLRKTCLTYLARNGCPAHLLQRTAGHSTLETTMRYYLGHTAGDADVIRAAMAQAKARIDAECDAKEQVA